MYKLPTNNLNYAYDFGAVYKLTLPGGKQKEKIVTKRVASAWQLSSKEIELIGNVWHADMLEHFRKQFNNPAIRLEYFDIEWCVVDQDGNQLISPKGY